MDECHTSNEEVNSKDWVYNSVYHLDTHVKESGEKGIKHIWEGGYFSLSLSLTLTMNNLLSRISYTKLGG